jgi:hypothetical protein
MEHRKFSDVGLDGEREAKSRWLWACDSRTPRHCREMVFPAERNPEMIKRSRREGRMMSKNLQSLPAEMPCLSRRSVMATVVAALLLATLAPACGLQRPIQSSGSAISKEGIQLRVLRQNCSETVQPKQPGNDLVEVIVEIEIRNGLSEPISVHRDGFRLGAPDGSAIKTSTWFAIDPVTVDAAQALKFQLRFMARGGLSCWREMALKAFSAVTRGTAPVEIGSVSFIPGHAPLGYGVSAN